MRGSALGLGLSLCVAAGPGLADHPDAFPEPGPEPAASHTHYTYADVVGVEPLVEYRTITEPRRECRVAGYAGASGAHPRYPNRDPSGHERYERHHDHGHPAGSPVAAVIGGVVGGLLGSQFGSGSGKKAMTVAGALAGASVARSVSRSRSHHQSGYTPRRCTTVMASREVEEVAGYRVRYVYQGEEFTKVVASDPGDHVRVQVQVTPAVGEPDW